MTVSTWISLAGLVVALLTAAGGYGALKSTVARLKEEIGELKAGYREALAALEAQHREAFTEFRGSRDKLGQRVGELEIKAALAENELSRPYRASPGKGGGEVGR